MEDPNDKEEAEVAKLVAEKWKIYSDIGAISGEQVALVEFANQPLSEVVDEDALEAGRRSRIRAREESSGAPPACLAAGPAGNEPGTTARSSAWDESRNATAAGNGPPLRPPTAAEHKYVIALKSVMRGVHDDTMAWLKPRLGRDAQREDQDKLTKTQLSSELAAHVDGLVNAGAESRQAIRAPRDGASTRTTARRWGRSASTCADSSGRTCSTSRSGIRASSRRPARDYSDQIAEILDDPDTWGLRIEEIESLLVERGGVSESRAALIARDQTSEAECEHQRDASAQRRREFLRVVNVARRARAR
jgi:hypothetical protein